MKKIFLLTVIGTLLLSACNKDDGNENQKQEPNSQNDTLCCFSGGIFLYNTGQSVGGAWLQFCEYNTDAIIHSELIDGDGRYETPKSIKKGSYYLRILKVDHIDTLYYFNGKADRKIDASYPLSAGCTPIDWAITAEAKTLWVGDINSPEQRKDTLRFGNDNKQSFQIRNNGGIRFNWWIKKQNYDWIKSITPADSGTLKLNDYINLTIEIDRNKLPQGTTTTLLIDSDEGGGRELTVKIL
jgi:hypothetical protein